MAWMDPLTANLLDLLFELRGHPIPLTMESEYRESLRLGKLYAGDGHVETAREIIRSDFAEPASIGVIRLREHPLFRPEFPVPDFLAVLNEILQV